jgi:hypothetical protein
MPSIDPVDQVIPERLYQINPKLTSTLPKGWRSKTESIESFRKNAKREYRRLKLNGTIPNHIVQLNYLIELPKKKIQELWKKLSRRLRLKGIVGIAAMEITKDSRQQRPVNRVHYHIVIKDHSRTQTELKELITIFCLREMDSNDFKINVFPFDDNPDGGWNGYIGYFVELRSNNGENILFRSGLWLRKYYTIGKWWTYSNGTERKLSDIDTEIQRYAATRRRLEELEQSIIININDVANWTQRANYRKLKQVLDNETDKTLYDWYSALLYKPAVFQSFIPIWLTETIQSYPYKCEDLLNAIEERIICSGNTDIIIALKIYHDF